MIALNANPIAAIAQCKDACMKGLFCVKKRPFHDFFDRKRVFWTGAGTRGCVWSNAHLLHTNRMGEESYPICNTGRSNCIDSAHKLKGEMFQG